MGVSNVMLTGRSGMMASRAGIATTGHNITNANTEGFSRQRVEFKSATPQQSFNNNRTIGTGVEVQRISRYNDEYLEKQVRNGAKDMAHLEEKDLHLTQVEDVFNEMGGEGLNRIMSRFFNDFRQLANDPESEAVRQTVRESSDAMITDFKRVRKELTEVSNHIDSRIDGYVREANATVDEVSRLNKLISLAELGSQDAANDLHDQRDQAVKKLATYVDISVHKDEKGNVMVDMPGVGPLISGPSADKFVVERSPVDEQGKRENTLDIKTTAYAGGPITHILKGGKIGALLEVRDKTLATILNRMDDLAYNVTTAVNEVHRQGFNREGQTGIDFFKQLGGKERAAEYLDLSSSIRGNVNNIAAAASADSPGDNRVAIALSGIQGLRMMNDGKATVDDFYNSIISDVGVMSSRNKSDLNQQKSINTQLNKMRDNLSGVSIDEEIANLLQFQHSFDASAKVIQVADSMLETVLNLRR